MSNPVSRKYDVVAKLYDWALIDYTYKTIAEALQLANLQGGEKILDIGCGTGPLEIKLCKLFPSVRIDACDISPGMIAQAERKMPEHPNVRFHVCDFTTLSFARHSYDAIFALSNLHYFPQAPAMLKHACELAKPGASLILLDWKKGSVRSQLYEHWMQRMDRSFQRIYTRSEMQELLASAGWHFEAASDFGIRGLWTMQEVRAKKN